MTLETKRLLLRPLTADDFEAVHSWASNPDNVRFMSFGPNTEEQTREFLTLVTAGRDFAVVLKATGTVIGSGGVYADEDNDTGHIGWILHRDYWQKGYGTEFGGEIIRYGFEDLKLRRLTAPCAVDNYGSWRVMERNGMRREALHRKAFWARIDKEWVDLVHYAILAEEYRLNKGKSVAAKATKAVTITYREASAADIDALNNLLFSLYHNEGQDSKVTWEELVAENEKILADENHVFFLAFAEDEAVGVSHGSLRREYVNGTNDELKGYLEAIYVVPHYRKKGIASELDKVIGHWAVKNGCREMASDCLLENTDSYVFHRRIGYEETERNIFFLKILTP
ncbi:MAG: GNAT family N-acetyltransferase [Lachnospiraceae bacterium]|nr:GNAT family N-acetyltransferase [Lachnospiraceae bacterium]